MAGKTKQPPIQPGDVLAGKYRVERALGTGGMGVVVEVVDLELGERRAIKVLVADRSSMDELEERFLREARAVSRLRSPHVARVYDVGRLPTGELYAVMEHLEGQDLNELLIARGSALGAQDAADFVMQVLEGLAEAHAAGIVHRDLKPANLFFTDDDSGSTCIKVLDFGVSKVSADLELGKEVTRTAHMLGTPLYMAPEQMRSAKNVDRRADIWSVGVILYKLLTTRTPFLGDTIATVCLDVAERDPLPPSTFNPNVSPELDAVVMRCLDKDVAGRYQNALELGTALAVHAGPTAQASLGRINRWHNAPPPLPSQPSFPGLEDRVSRPSLPEAPSSLPSAPSGAGRDEVAPDEAPTVALRRRSTGLWSAARRWWLGGVVGLAGVGLAVALVLGLSADDGDPEPASQGSTISLPAASPPPAETAPPAEPAGTVTEAAGPGVGGGAATSGGGAPPVSKPKRPPPRPTRAKTATPPPAKPAPPKSSADPFGKGRW